ncbi:MAG: hypothetical protein F6K00_33960 [Leptolyngbya sp. SIOISBB]|nr:hypothetical protein [Leptolyngbya sp. SIOISBB]
MTWCSDGGDDGSSLAAAIAQPLGESYRNLPEWQRGGVSRSKRRSTFLIDIKAQLQVAPK